MIVRPAQGRRYSMGNMSAIFFADREETDSRYSVSEWWLQPNTKGPHPHDHEDDHIFCVIAGTVSLLTDGEWTDAGRGCYAVIPGGVTHTFENRGTEECGFISVTIPGGFEYRMPDIVKWFEEQAAETGATAASQHPADSDKD